jgi:hypothetical protein
MNRVGILVAVGVAAALTAVAGAPSAPPPPSVHGAGWIAYTDFPSAGETTVEHLALSARIGPDGDPQGTIVGHSPFGDSYAEVTCLVQQDEKTVYVGGRITRGFTYLGQEMSHIAFGIEDNGQGRSAPDLVAGAIFRARPDRPPDFDPCARLLPFPPFYAVERGNFVVGTGPTVGARVVD